MKALVTGGGGFLGRHIVEALLSRGHEVAVLCRGDYPELRQTGVRLIKADLADSAAVRAACAGVDRVFHVAAKTGMSGGYNEFYQTNVTGTRNVIDGCKAQGVNKLIYTSTPSVLVAFDDLSGVNEEYPYPGKIISAYQHTKMLAEQMVLAANGEQGIMTTALRPHAIWGPRDSLIIPVLIKRHEAGKLMRIGSGRNKISISYVENTAWWHLQAADSDNVGGKAYFVSEPEPVEMWAWIDGLLAVVGLPPVKRQVSYGTAYALGCVCEAATVLMPWLGEPSLTRSLAALCAKDHYFDISAARRDFGLTSPVPMDEANRRFAEYYLSLSDARNPS